MSADKAQDAAALLAYRRPASARGATNAEAAGIGEIVIVTVPWQTQAAVLEDIAPMSQASWWSTPRCRWCLPRSRACSFRRRQSAALAAQKRLGPGVRVVAAFHNVAAHKLQKDAPVDCDVLVFGDEPTDREVVIGLAHAMGLRGVHAGPLVELGRGRGPHLGADRHQSRV